MLNSKNAKRKPPMKLVEDNIDEEMPYVGPNVQNFQSFPRKFSKYIFIYLIT